MKRAVTAPLGTKMFEHVYCLRVYAKLINMLGEEVDEKERYVYYKNKTKIKDILNMFHWGV